jgi:predicted RNA-binding Zn-ribbon protein involved in translation (DUF1610 family)
VDRCKRLQGKWLEMKCTKCGGPTFVKRKNVNKFGEEWTCKDCRNYSKTQAHDACVALALRKKKMGLLR